MSVNTITLKTMKSRNLHAVTGAYGYTGKQIAKRLLERGCGVVTLTNSPGKPHPFGDRVPARPLSFGDLPRLTASLADVDTLYNTYWVRFNHRDFRHSEAVENTLALFAAARAAGVRRIVHVSITNPDEHSPLEYFAGKGLVEHALRASGVFGVFGDGRYRLRPIHVDDLAALAVETGAQSGPLTLDAVGPEAFSYEELVRTIGKAIHHERPVIHITPGLGYVASRIIGRCVHDIFITREEIRGLMAGLLDVDGPPTGAIRLSGWCGEHAGQLGMRYASELARRRGSVISDRSA